MTKKKVIGEVEILILHQQDGGPEIQGVFATHEKATARKTQIQELFRGKGKGWPLDSDFTIESYEVEG